MKLMIKLLRQGAKAPTRATAGSAGYDLYACLEKPLCIAPGEAVGVPTGFAMALPDSGCVGLVYARSGLAIKHGLVPQNCVGVIDSDYRGEVLVALRNQSAAAYTVAPGERIAQMLVVPVLTPELTLTDDLGSSERGEKGFGSSGRN